MWLFNLFDFVYYLVYPRNISTPEHVRRQARPDAPAKGFTCLKFSRVRPNQSDFRHLIEFSSRMCGHGCILLMHTNYRGDDDRISGVLAFPIGGLSFSDSTMLAVRRELPNFLIVKSTCNIYGCVDSLLQESLDDVKRCLFS